MLKQNPLDWLSRVHPQYLKRKVDFMTLGQARQITERKFIKPADDKCFAAQVYEAGTLKPLDLLPDDTSVLVSDPIEFDLEYRTFVDGTRVLTWSNYVCFEHIADPRQRNMVPLEESLLPYEFVNNLLFSLDRHDADLRVQRRGCRKNQRAGLGHYRNQSCVGLRYLRL